MIKYSLFIYFIITFFLIILMKIINNFDLTQSKPYIIYNFIQDKNNCGTNLAPCY
jgi:hypothetical protein